MPENIRACVQAGFCHEVRLCMIRPCRRVALVAWPGPGVCRHDNVARRAIRVTFLLEGREDHDGLWLIPH